MCCRVFACARIACSWCFVGGCAEKSVCFAADLSRRDAALAGEQSEDKASAASKVTALLMFHVP